jgi:hypothetical protein
MVGTPPIRRMVKTFPVIAALMLLGLGLPAGAIAAPSHSTTARAHVASRHLVASLGGTVSLGGARIYVPGGVMRADGDVSIDRLAHGRYRFAIDAPWGGYVRVTLPLRQGHDAVVHALGGIWLAEGRRYGKNTVWVSHLSVFSTLKNIVDTPFSVLSKAAVAVKCVRLTVVPTLKCLAKEGVKSVGGDVLSWVVSQVSHNCAAAITANNVGAGPLIPVTTLMSIIGFEPACTEQLGSGELPPGYDVNGHPIQNTTSSTGGTGSAGTGSQSTSSASGWVETAGGALHTWSDYAHAGGSAGPDIAGGKLVVVSCRLNGFTVTDGNSWWYRVASSPWNNAYYVSADGFYNNGATEGPLKGTPFVDSAVAVCAGSSSPGGSDTPPGTGPAPTPEATFAETTGGVAHTWTNYANAGGTQGPDIASGQRVQIACWVDGFRVSDGNTKWYRVASSPWNDAYYVSADAFYNNGSTSGTLSGTPFVDPAVPSCGGGGGSTAGSKPTYAETAGGVAHTWTNPANAGGTQGPSIGANQTVQIACWVAGFRVTDGNTYWYEIASSPWNDAYFVSADAFYNNGATSGSLIGTPFVDSGVPAC